MVNQLWTFVKATVSTKIQCGRMFSQVEQVTITCDTLAAVRQEAYRFIRPITPGCQYRLGFYGPQLIAGEAMGALEP